jgi:hypothetical protein
VLAQICFRSVPRAKACDHFRIIKHHYLNIFAQLSQTARIVASKGDAPYLLRQEACPLDDSVHGGDDVLHEVLRESVARGVKVGEADIDIRRRLLRLQHVLNGSNDTLEVAKDDAVSLMEVVGDIEGDNFQVHKVLDDIDQTIDFLKFCCTGRVSSIDFLKFCCTGRVSSYKRADARQDLLLHYGLAGLSQSVKETCKTLLQCLRSSLLRLRLDRIQL